MCTLRFKCSCACIFTCFVDLVLISVPILTIICSHVYQLRWSNAIMFTSNFFVHMLWWSYISMFTFFDNYILLCLHALKRTCPHTIMLICSDTSMIGCSYVCIPLCWSHVSMVICSHVYMLKQLHAHLLLKFHGSYLWTIWWLYAPTLKCFDNHMHTGIDIHTYDICAHVHTHGC